MKNFNIKKIIFFFFKGLERNFKIIRYGDIPKIYQIPIHLEKYSFASGTLASYFSVVKNLFMHLLRPDQKIYDIPDSEVLFCGGSSNNEREFVFFSELLSDEIHKAAYIRDKNISFVSARVRKKKPVEFVLSLLVFGLCCCYLLRIKMGPVSFKYLVSYARIYLQVFSSFRRAKHLPQLMVVANDHTDFPVVTAMLMKCFDIPVVYLQHAEVSNAFPLLDFDISILRNQKSLDKYKEVGPVTGDIFIIPRAKKFIRAENFNIEARLPVQVVLYLSSVFNSVAVRDCIDLLSKNPGVAMVSIKRHPRANAALLHDFSDITIYDQSPQYKHIAIVPNSSVAVELLEQGIAVFQYFALDDIPIDYYGLVADGVTPAIVRQSLLQEFWRTNFYDAVWLQRFKNYSPAVDDSWRESMPALTAHLQVLLRDSSS